jgi:hypothetical protein
VCQNGMTMGCYNGPNGTQGVGVCKGGTQTCLNGQWGPCVGEVDPTPESCNGVDDNCNQMTDENLGTISCGIGACKATVNACTNGKPTTCVAGNAVNEVCNDGVDNNCNGQIDEGCGCVYVVSSGVDGPNCGPANAPCQTIQYAITNRAGVNGLPNQVCVAANNTCNMNAPATQDYQENVVMKNGVHVYGGYQASGNVWPRTAGCTTRILPNQPLGVVFDHPVVTPTVLDGFTVIGHNDPTSAAITVRGSTGAMINNDIVTGAGQTTSYGIDVVDVNGMAATPTITRSGITGGDNAMTAAGIHSLNSAPIIQANCDIIDNNTGRCTSSSCFAAPVARFIRSRANNQVGANSWGIRLEASPKAVVAQNSICSQGATGTAAAVYLNADALVEANWMMAFTSAMTSVGVWADPCRGASPWILNNQQITATSTLMGGRTDGIRAVGDCHVRVDSNFLIAAGIEQAQAATNGVWCTLDPNSGLSSKCTVLNNVTIRGSNGGFPPTSVGVRCDDGACARIENNTLITGQGGTTSYGVFLGRTGPFINNNHLDAGCPTVEGNGLYSLTSFARVQNNYITGPICANGLANNYMRAYGVHVISTNVQSEIDLHSNDIFAAGLNNICTGSALAFDALQGGAPPIAPLGIVRNNILEAGGCPTRYQVNELNNTADPRLFENNDLYAIGNPPTALYRDENMTNLTMLAQVNGLVAGPVAANNISANPTFVNYPTDLHLQAGSMCIDKGTMSGAPATDFEGQMRPRANGFDIGIDEF